MPPRVAPTHFLCLPLVTATSRPQLAQNLGAFRADVSSFDSFALPSEAVRPVGTLHLTLGVMSFPKGEGLDKALELLGSLRPREIIDGIRPLPALTALARPSQPAGVNAKPANGASLDAAPPGTIGSALAGGTGTETERAAPLPLRITLRGLHPMQKASETTVLYAPPVDDDNVLQRFCDAVRAPFLKAGLMADENRPLLLHATVVNTIYVRNGGQGAAVRRQPSGRGQGRGQGRGRRSRITIDARDVLARYGDYVWMEDVPVESVAICRMGAKDVEGSEGDQAYEVAGEIAI